MNITFMDKKMDAEPKMRDYAEKKVAKIDRLFRRESDASIVFSKERGRSTAEVTLRNNGTIFRSSETTGDMYASIDSAVAAIERQIRRNKGRLAKKLKEEHEWQTEEAVEATPVEEESDFEVIRSKRFAMKPMTVEEAILQMNLLGHSFYAFRNMDEDGAFAVVYTRKNGGYGLMSDAPDEE